MSKYRFSSPFILNVTKLLFFMKAKVIKWWMQPVQTFAQDYWLGIDLILIKFVYGSRNKFFLCESLLVVQYKIRTRKHCFKLHSLMVNKSTKNRIKEIFSCKRVAREDWWTNPSILRKILIQFARIFHVKSHLPAEFFQTKFFEIHCPFLENFWIRHCSIFIIFKVKRYLNRFLFAVLLLQLLSL